MTQGSAPTVAVFHKKFQQFIPATVAQWDEHGASVHRFASGRTPEWYPWSEIRQWIDGSADLGSTAPEQEHFPSDSSLLGSCNNSQATLSVTQDDADVAVLDRKTGQFVAGKLVEEQEHGAVVRLLVGGVREAPTYWYPWSEVQAPALLHLPLPDLRDPARLHEIEPDASVFEEKRQRYVPGKIVDTSQDQALVVLLLEDVQRLPQRWYSLSEIRPWTTVEGSASSEEGDASQELRDPACLEQIDADVCVFDWKRQKFVPGRVQRRDAAGADVVLLLEDVHELPTQWYPAAELRPWALVEDPTESEVAAKRAAFQQLREVSNLQQVDPEVSVFDWKRKRYVPGKIVEKHEGGALVLLLLENVRELPVQWYPTSEIRPWLSVDEEEVQEDVSLLARLLGSQGARHHKQRDWQFVRLPEAEVTSTFASPSDNVELLEQATQAEVALTVASPSDSVELLETQEKTPGAEAEAASTCASPGDNVELLETQATRGARAEDASTVASPSDNVEFLETQATLGASAPQVPPMPCAPVAGRQHNVMADIATIVPRSCSKTGGASPFSPQPPTEEAIADGVDEDKMQGGSVRRFLRVTQAFPSLGQGYLHASVGEELLAAYQQDGWYYGLALGDRRREGWFHSGHVAELDDDDLVRGKVVGQGCHVAFVARAQKTFLPLGPGYLGATIGEELVVRFSQDCWYFGFALRDRERGEGWFFAENVAS